MPNRRFHRLALTAAVTLALTACGGGTDDEDAAADPGTDGGTAVTLTCDTKLFVADSVVAPTVTQLAAYVGTYTGDEGSFGPNPGDPFVKTGTADVVLKADGTVTYKAQAITVTSMCLDKKANGTGEVFLYVHSANGHVDFTDKGAAFGVSLIDGKAILQNGKKKV